MTQILGIMQACPSNNLKLFNLRMSCETWSLTEAIEFICPGYTSDQDNVRTIVFLMITYFISNSGGLPTGVEFNEDLSIKSKIESELFAGRFKRTYTVATALEEDGAIPATSFSEAERDSILNTVERIEYMAASRKGDTKRLRHFNSIVAKALAKANNGSSSVKATGPDSATGSDPEAPTEGDSISST